MLENVSELKKAAHISEKDCHATHNEFDSDSDRAVAGGTKLTAFVSEKMASDLGLDEKDLMVIERLLNALLNGNDGIQATEIIEGLESDAHEVFKAIGRIQRLRDFDIIETVRSLDDDQSAVELLRSRLRVTDGFFRKIFDCNKNEDIEEAQPYENNQDYLADQFERIRLLEEMDGRTALKSSSRWKSFKPSDQANKEKMLKSLEEKIQKRLSLSTTAFPFEKLKKEIKLAGNEEVVVLALLRKEVFSGSGYDADDLMNFIAKTQRERLSARGVFAKDGRLYKKKILEHSEPRYPFGSSKIRLNEKITNLLLGEKKKSRREKREKDDFFEIIKPEVTLEDVILHAKTLEEISLATEKIEGVVAKRLAEWGFESKNLSEPSRKNKNIAVTMLFYGPPGTGKTLTAHAIAGRLKKEVLVFDCSTIIDTWVGESEKNTRMIFDRYRELAKRKKNPPVLMLNEADQFLHRRIEATRSTDHMYNQMQNIFLEQIENFNGILIATTNLVGSIDEAFSRRFSQKIEFRRPGTKERYKLWHAHIPSQAPMGEDVDLWSLAESYNLSGGQIALVVNNAATRAAIRGDKICQEDFITSCKDEMKGNFDEKAKSSIGF